MASQGKRMVPKYLIKELENLFKSDLTVKITVGSIDHITSEDLSSLECGDIVCKEDSTGKHAYVVSYKSEEGICLTYTDASIVETVSYDYTGGEWVYNSTDITPIAEPLIQNIVDSNGNKRFIEGAGTLNPIEGITYTYNKWSLSGTHLMLVVAGTIADETVISGYPKLVDFDLPQYILDKIIPVVGIRISNQQNNLFAADNSSQLWHSLLAKVDNLHIRLTVSPLTLTADRSFRIQYDLLIDTE